MEIKENLATMSTKISSKLLDSINLLETLGDVYDGSTKEGTLISILSENIESAFLLVEECRKVISDT